MLWLLPLRGLAISARGKKRRMYRAEDALWGGRRGPRAEGAGDAEKRVFPWREGKIVFLEKFDN